jgi:hypothetical protein
MTLRGDMEPWVLDALRRLGGEARVDLIAENVWNNHEEDLRAIPRALWTWQYEMRWSGDNLVKKGLIEKTRRSWKLLVD